MRNIRNFQFLQILQHKLEFSKKVKNSIFFQNLEPFSDFLKIKKFFDFRNFKQENLLENSKIFSKKTTVPQQKTKSLRFQMLLS